MKPLNKKIILLMIPVQQVGNNRPLLSAMLPKIKNNSNGV